jgi:alkylation response protein AidB-like acyl-CoA dehydrogenase
MRYAPFALAESLERILGDPADERVVFCDEACLRLDETETFPDEICRQLDEWGLPGYYVPVEYGGSLRTYEDVLQVIRTVSRRDLTVAIGHGKTYLGSVCVWVAGSPAQARWLAGVVLRGVPVSLGLTERAHGSDLATNDVAAEPPGGGDDTWTLSGEKWLINNATRGGVLSVLTRTSPEGGPRGFSVFLVDKRDLDPHSYAHVPKIHTHGVRAADISGIVLDRARVPADRIVGGCGAGLEAVIKALQITRTMCAALSLGAADHGLDIALDFAATRQLYGHRLDELPSARQTLAEAVADVLLDEAVAITAARAVHLTTEELSVVAAVTKYLVPTHTEHVLRELTRVLGARAFLKGVHRRGMFQKIERDHRLVGIFDGNTLVNLTNLVNQFRTLARKWDQRATAPAAALAAAHAACTFAGEVPPLEPARLALVSRQGNSFVHNLGRYIAEVRDAALSDAELAPLAGLAERLRVAAVRLHAEMRQAGEVAGDIPFETFELAKRYCVLHAAVTGLGVWVANRGELAGSATGPLWQGGLWLQIALAASLRRMGEQVDLPDSSYDAFYAAVSTMRAAGLLTSLLPFPIAAARGAGSGRISQEAR